MVRFGRQLRAAGVRVTTTQVAQFARAIGHVDIGDPVSVRDAARCTLVSHRDELATFERVFTELWRQGSASGAPRLDDRRSDQPVPTQIGLPETRLSPDEPADAADRDVVDRVLTYSATEVLRHKRFEELSPGELAELQRLISRFTLRLHDRLSRRHSRAAHGPQLDWRRTIAAAVRHDGEWITRRWRRRRRMPRPLVVMADVSGSMERYTRLLLTFLHAMTRQSSRHGQRRRIETFVFGTRLTRTTRALASRDVDTALAAVSRRVADWAGGTRIGESLRVFNRVWARRVLGRGAIVIIISDGWDRGDPALVAKEMSRLRRSCSRLVWLNPLIGTEAFAPRTRGLVAALPHADDFLPIHNLASLEELTRHLEGLRSSRRGGSPRGRCTSSW